MTPNEVGHDPNLATDDLTDNKIPPPDGFVIARRPHFPGYLQKQINSFPEEYRKGMESMFAWSYNKSEVINKETASTLAKANHRTCNGKGYVEFSRIPMGYNLFRDEIRLCQCALKNGEKIHV